MSNGQDWYNGTQYPIEPEPLIGRTPGLHEFTRMLGARLSDFSRAKTSAGETVWDETGLGNIIMRKAAE